MRWQAGYQMFMILWVKNEAFSNWQLMWLWNHWQLTCGLI